MFCYSGHGSQEQAPEQFWTIEPDHLDETLVLYDSAQRVPGTSPTRRCPGSSAEVAAGGAHVLVRAGLLPLRLGHPRPGAGRDGGAAGADRPSEAASGELHLPLEELAAVGTSRTRGHAPPAGTPPDGMYCWRPAATTRRPRSTQGGGATRGAFSYFLGETLRTVGGAVTYRDLFARAAALVRSQVQRQSPQLEATVSEDLLRPFLGGAIRPAPRYFVASVPGRPLGDRRRAGARHNGSHPNDATELALFVSTPPRRGLAGPGQGSAKPGSLGPGTTSQLEIVERRGGPRAQPLKAVITQLPNAPTTGQAGGRPSGGRADPKALATSQFVREAHKGEVADFRLIARGEQY